MVTEMTLQMNHCKSLNLAKTAYDIFCQVSLFALEF